MKGVANTLLAQLKTKGFENDTRLQGFFYEDEYEKRAESLGYHIVCYPNRKSHPIFEQIVLLERDFDTWSGVQREFVMDQGRKTKTYLFFRNLQDAVYVKLMID